MPNLSICGGDLIVLIEGADDLTFAFSIVGDIDWGGAVQKMAAPAPIGAEITDHIVRAPDRVSLNGILSCSKCGVVTPVLAQELPALTKAISRQVYDNQFYTITSNLGVATNMVLMSYNVRQTQRETQLINVSMSFEAANLAGDISAPSYEAGGIVA